MREEVNLVRLNRERRRYFQSYDLTAPKLVYTSTSQFFWLNMNTVGPRYNGNGYKGSSNITDLTYLRET